MLPAPATSTSLQAANTFAATCLKSAQEGRPISTTFSDNPQFRRVDWPQPGPGAVAYAAEFMTGRTQAVKRDGKIRRSCAIYAEVSDHENIHQAVDAVVSKSLAARVNDDSGKQAVRRIAIFAGDQKTEVISSRLAPAKAGALHQLGGNVLVIMYTEENA